MKLLQKSICLILLLSFINFIQAHSSSDNFIDINGDKIHYEIKGRKGPWIILVHGVGSDERAFNSIFEPVSEYARVVRYTRSGLGESSYKAKSKSLDSIVDELASLINKLDIKEPMILAGHSYGGLIIRSYISRYQPNVKGLMFLDTTFEDYFPILEPLLPNARVIERNDYESNYTTKTSQAKKDEIESMFKVWNSPERWSDWFKPLPPVVTTVITSLKIIDAPIRGTKEIMQARYVVQSKLLKHATIATHIGLKGAGHYVQRDDPEIVIEAFKTLIKLSEK